MKMRLQKFLSMAGVASRRKAETLILAGKIKINGVTVNEMGIIIDDEKDRVSFYDNKPIEMKSEKIFIALNKPVGYISSADNTQGKSVLDLVKIKERVYPVGRLDKDSTGLILLTNDGELANKITHPKFGFEKEYLATLDQVLTGKDAAELERGIVIEGQLMKIFKVLSIKNKNVRLVLKEGANRQIRRMMGQLGYDVIELKRTRIGKLKLGDLIIGKWKKVDIRDII